MENRELLVHIRNLKEWAPLADLLNKIPLKILKGVFTQDLSVTCVDVLPEFVALGTDAGIVYWFNRSNGELQKLRCELNAAITCIKIISSVEYLIAVGNVSGQVTVFQIQKELPPELTELPAITNVVHKEPIKRYTIKDLDRSAISCLEWSKNGMKLFSGDRQGVVVLTEFDFAEYISKSGKILNEAYGIVQIGFNSPWLLVSTVYRAIICRKNGATGDWNVSQIGKKDRKILNDFGAVFVGSNRKQPSIVCSRPGFRFWLSDTDGNVSHTFLLKDAVSEPTYEIPILNPGLTRLPDGKLSHFGPCYNYNGSFIITHCDTVIYIINLEKLKIEATIRRLRKIQYLACNGWEIFVLEGGRSLIRIAPFPESTQFQHRTGSQFSQIHATDSSSSSVSSSSGADSTIFEPPIEYEPEEETVMNGDECFELPPIEYIHLDTPLYLNEPNLLKQDRLLLEHSRKLELFEKINQLDYDDSILFKTAMKKKKKVPANIQNATSSSSDGIVEIGRQAIANNLTQTETDTECVKDSKKDHGPNLRDLRSASSSQENKTKKQLSMNRNKCDTQETPNLECKPNTSYINSSRLDRNLVNTEEDLNDGAEFATNACLLEASFCENVNLVSNLRSPTAIRKELKEKEDHLAAALNIKPVVLEQIKIKPDAKKLSKITVPPPRLINFSYPLNYPITEYDENKTVLKLENPISSNKSISKLSSTLSSSPSSSAAMSESNKTQPSTTMYQSQMYNNLNEKLPSNGENLMSQSLNFTSNQTMDLNDIPAIRKIPDYMHIPNLWDIKIEEANVGQNGMDAQPVREQTSASSESSCSEWEFV